MREVLRKWTPREKCVKYQNFPTHFGLSLSLECSGEISRKELSRGNFCQVRDVNKNVQMT